MKKIEVLCFKRYQGSGLTNGFGSRLIRPVHTVLQSLMKKFRKLGALEYFSTEPCLEFFESVGGRQKGRVLYSPAK